MKPKVLSVLYNSMTSGHDAEKFFETSLLSHYCSMSFWLFCLEAGALHPAWGAFQLTETLPPAGISLGIAGPGGSTAKLTRCVRAEEGKGPSLR